MAKLFRQSFLVEPSLDFANSFEILLSDHCIQLLVLSQGFLLFLSSAQGSRLPVTAILLLDLFLCRSKLGERGHRSIAELLVDLGLHLSFCLDLETLESFARIFAVEHVFFHRVVLCLPNKPLILAKYLLRQLEHLQLSIGLHQQLLVEIESRGSDVDIFARFLIRHQTLQSFPGLLLVDAFGLASLDVFDHLLQEKHDTVGRHELFSHWIYHKAILALHLVLKALHGIGI